MAERSWSICFLCQNDDTDEKLHAPSRKVGVTTKYLKETFKEQISLLAKFKKDALMPATIKCDDMLMIYNESGEDAAVDVMLSNKKNF